MEGELKQLESIYRDAHTRLVDTHKQFDDEVQTLYKVHSAEPHHNGHIWTTIIIKWL